MCPLLLLSVAGSAAERAGEITGGGLAVVALLIGALKSAQIARRPTTSALCAYGLMLVLLGWLSFGLITFLRTLSVAGAPVTILLSALGLLLLGAGAVLAVAGLVDYRRHPEYVQGRKQAGWALAIFGLMCLMVVVGGVLGIISAVRERRAAETVAPAPEAESRRLLFEDLNLRYEMPPAPWVRWDATKVNPDVTFGLLRTRPKVSFLVIAESAGGTDVIDTAALSEVAKANLRSSAEVVFSEEVLHTVAGLEGTRFFAEAQLGQRRLSYVFWVSAHNGFLYQLITSGAQAERAAVHREAEVLLQGFSLIDPERRAPATSEEPFGTYRSDTLGLVIDLAETRWHKWEDATEKNPEAEVGGLHGYTGGFLVTPLVFDDAPPHLAALTQAALTEWGIDYPSADFTHLEPVTQSGMTGHSFRYQRRVDGVDYEYRMRCLIGPGRGLFVSVWATEGNDDLEERAQEVFSALRLEGEPAALGFESLPERQRLAQARMHNDIGHFHFKAKDYGTSLNGFQAAVRADPSERTYLLDVLSAFGEQSAWDAGLAYLRDLEHPARHDDEVRSWEAWFNRHSGKSRVALRIYDDLFARGFRGDDDLRAYGALLAEADRWGDVREVFDRYLAKETNLALRLEQARLLGSGGRQREAIEVLEAEQQRMPFSAEIAWELLGQHDALDQHRQRLALCEALMENGLASADVFYVKGDAEVALKWYRRAKASFEEGLKHSPDDRDLLDYLQHVSGLLGEGNNSEIKQPIAPVPLPPSLEKRLSRVESPPGQGFGAHYVYWIEGIAFERGRRALSTTRQRIRVEDMSGVERFSTIEIEFSPLSERVYVNELAVRDATGRMLSQGRDSDYYVVDSQEYEGTTHNKILYIPVPGLKPGRVVDLTYTRLERGTPSELSFRAIPLGTRRPTGLRAVYFHGDPEQLRHRSANGLSAQPFPGGLLWSIEQPPVFPWEPLQVRSMTVVPALWLGDATAEWAGLTEDYLARIEDKLLEANAVSARARRLVEGVDDPQSRIEALMQHVQRDYVYKPIEFGRRAQIPNEAAETMRLGYGDCKDHAVLLKQLLKAISVPSQLALVSTSSRIQQEIPSLDQFNHVILRVATEPSGSGRFFDPTDKGLPLGITPPVALANRLALVLDPADPHFERLPKYGADSSTVTVTREVQITTEGTLSINEDVEISGYYAAWLRDYLATLESARHEEWAQRALARTERTATLRTLTTSHIDDSELPLGLHVSYDLAQRCHEESDALRCPLPAPWEVRYLDVEPVSDRRTPFEISYPLRIRAKTTVRAPGPGSVEAGPDASGGQADLATWSLRTTSGSPSATLEFDCSQREGEHPAGRYSQYSQTVSQALRSATREVVWHRE